MKRFTPTHEWIEMNEGIGTVGISDHAQKELGEVVYVELPEIGQELKGGEEACVLESTKAAADIYSPASGKVVAVNEQVKTNPSLINKAAESSGWLYKMSVK